MNLKNFLFSILTSLLVGHSVYAVTPTSPLAPTPGNNTENNAPQSSGDPVEDLWDHMNTHKEK